MNRYGPPRQPGDEGLQVTFYNEPAEDKEASVKEGRPIFRDADFIQIHVPADPSCDIATQVNNEHIRRFPHEYKQFKESQQVVEGTPIKMWAAVSRASAMELAGVGILSVEELSEVEASELRKQPWLKPFVEKAKIWLKSIADDGVALRLESHIQELQKQILALEAENLELRTAQNEVKKRPAKAAQ